MKRVWLLLGLAVGCVPGGECGWVEQGPFETVPPDPGRCARITVEEGFRAARSPADGCTADSAGRCVILMPGETAQAFGPDDSLDSAVGAYGGTRQNATLVDGACPLVCP